MLALHPRLEPGTQTTAAAHEARSREWLGRLTHVCLSSNALRELPTPLLEHATALEELDLAYNHTLQIGAKAAAAVAKLGRSGALHAGGAGELANNSCGMRGPHLCPHLRLPRLPPLPTQPAPAADREELLAHAVRPLDPGLAALDCAAAERVPAVES